MSDRQILWSDTKPSGPTCSYDHMIGKYGRFYFRLEWKSWKEYESVACYAAFDLTATLNLQASDTEGVNRKVAFDFIGVSDRMLDRQTPDLEAAKGLCQEWLNQLNLG